MIRRRYIVLACATIILTPCMHAADSESLFIRAQNNIHAYTKKCVAWVKDHKGFIAGSLAGVGALGVWMYQRRQSHEILPGAILPTPSLSAKEVLFDDTALRQAAYDGDIPVISAALKPSHIDVNAPDDEGMTVLMGAAANDQIAAMEHLLQHPGINGNVQNHRGRTALIIAVRNGREAAVRCLLAHRDAINVNAADNEGFTALMFAVLGEHEAVVRHLLDHPDIDLNAQTEGDETPNLTALDLARQLDKGPRIIELLEQASQRNK